MSGLLNVIEANVPVVVDVPVVQEIVPAIFLPVIEVQDDDVPAAGPAAIAGALPDGTSCAVLIAPNPFPAVVVSTLTTPAEG